MSDVFFSRERTRSGLRIFERCHLMEILFVSDVNFLSKIFVKTENALCTVH